ncbi:hypothetical protein ALC53_12479 [Atta colombica]|uniref:Uncharacterized protein n=1 Tax=Atta colombica TaxID=520822 RepID=A0A195AZ04_9HYME|nr:hypothetical protein ALC53_12479 [Atta colombica]
MIHRLVLPERTFLRRFVTKNQAVIIGNLVSARDSSDKYSQGNGAYFFRGEACLFAYANSAIAYSIKPCSAYFESMQDPRFLSVVAVVPDKKKQRRKIELQDAAIRTSSLRLPSRNAHPFLTQTLRKSAYPTPFLSHIIYNLYPEISCQCSNKHITETVSDTSFEQYLTPTISLALVLLTSTSSILPRAFQSEQCNVINIIILFVLGDGTFRTATATYNMRASKLVPDTVERIDQSAANRIPHLTTTRGSAGVLGGKAAIRRTTVWHALRRNEKKGCSRNTDVSRKRKERLLEWKKNRISRVFELFQDIIFNCREGSFNSMSCQVHLEIICFPLDQDSSMETGLFTFLIIIPTGRSLTRTQPSSCALVTYGLLVTNPRVIWFMRFTPRRFARTCHIASIYVKKILLIGMFFRFRGFRQ